MKFRKFAVAVALVAVGSLALAPMVRADDKDHDGLANQQDKLCEFSDINSPIFIGTCNTGAANSTHLAAGDPDRGCTIADLLDRCLVTSANDVDYEKCAKKVGTDARDQGRITTANAKKIFQCAQKLNALPSN